MLERPRRSARFWFRNLLDRQFEWEIRHPRLFRPGLIDLGAAYDHFDRDILFSVLNKRTKAFKITSIIKALYTGTAASIKNTANSFKVHTGCRQGCIESPLLFNFYMDFAG